MNTYVFRFGENGDTCRGMSRDEIVAELNRFRSLPFLNDICRDAGMDYRHVWQIVSGKCGLTKRSQARLSEALISHRRAVQATFSVPPDCGRPSSLEIRRSGR